MAFIQRYVASQRHQEAVHRQHHQPRLLQQAATAQQSQVPLQSVETINQQQEVEIPIEQYHIETSPRRPILPIRPPIYYAPEHQHAVSVTPVPSISPTAVTTSPPQPSQRPQQLHYHQHIPIQHYGFENGPEQVRIPQQSQAINSQLHAQAEAEAQARAQAQANAAALEFQKIANAAHIKHTQSALEQIRLNEEKYRQQEQLRLNEEKYRQQQSALDQIKEGERLSEAEISQRVSFY